MYIYIGARGIREQRPVAVLQLERGRSLEEAIGGKDEAFHNLESSNYMDYNPPKKDKPIHN